MSETKKLKSLKQPSVLVAVVVLLALGMFAFTSFQQTTDKITAALKKGDAKSLAVHFNKSVEVVIFDKENIYSKEQAELVVKDFFKKFPPKNFEVQHSGGPDEAKYSIGIYTSGSKKFRVYYLLKTTNKKQLIHLLRIEKE